MPESSQGDRVVATLIGHCALAVGRRDYTENFALGCITGWRQRAIRRDRYLHLLALVNGWPDPEPLAPVLDWSVTALRSRRCNEPVVPTRRTGAWNEPLALPAVRN
jgi:hypothetical protein